LDGGERERGRELTTAAAMAGADCGVLGQEPQLRAFIADTRAPWQIHFMLKGPTREGTVRRASACGRGGQIDGAAASLRTLRGAWVLRPRRGLEVRAVLTHTGLTPRLRGPAVVRRCTAAASRRRVASRRSVRRHAGRALGPVRAVCPCLRAQFSKIYM
jgi:hypothetical protein